MAINLHFGKGLQPLKYIESRQRTMTQNTFFYRDNFFSTLPNLSSLNICNRCNYLLHFHYLRCTYTYFRILKNIETSYLGNLTPATVKQQ